MSDVPGFTGVGGGSEAVFILPIDSLGALLHQNTLEFKFFSLFESEIRINLSLLNEADVGLVHTSGLGGRVSSPYIGTIWKRVAEIPATSSGVRRKTARLPVTLRSGSPIGRTELRWTP